MIVAEQPLNLNWITEVSKVIRERWQALSDDEKAVYVKQAAEDKERYSR